MASSLALQHRIASPRHPAAARDEDLARAVVVAMGAFADAVNAAASAGLVVEPRFERVQGRLPGVAESYVAEVEMGRRTD